MADFDAIVVGAGIGGLASAMRLNARGARVLVLEKRAQAGGKMRTVPVAGREMDSGPSVLTMKHVFEDLFASCGLELSEFVRLEPLDVLARHAWPDGGTLDLFRDRDRTADAIAVFAGRREADAYLRFCSYAAEIYQRVEAPFIGAPKASLSRMISGAGWRGALDLLRVDWHRSMWRSLGDFFRDPRLRQLFARYATYYGSSPFEAPATLNLIAHVEQLGVWRVAGGMQRLAHAMTAALRERGVEVVFGAGVTDVLVESGRARGVRLGRDTTIAAEAVILNGDPNALAQGRFGEVVRRAVAPQTGPRSLSAITFGWVARPVGLDLAYHTVLFSPDYENEFRSIFQRREVPSRPTVYVCAQDRTGPVRDADKPERLFALINAPATGDTREFNVDVPRWRALTQAALTRCGLTVTDVQGERVTTPTDFAEMFPASGGALYGPATHSAMGAFARPGVRTRVPGLLLAGGGVHPGAGVPMVALSGRWAAEAASADLAVPGSGQSRAASGSAASK